MYGVTQAVYDDFRTRLKKLPKQTVKKITKEEAHEVYDVLYWRAAGCDRLPWPINYLVFDAAVNSGVGRAVLWMQAALGVEQDGRVGPATLAKARQAVETGQGQVLLDVVNQRATFLAQLVLRQPSQAAFLLGWWRRTLRVLGRALTEEQEE